MGSRERSACSSALIWSRRAFEALLVDLQSQLFGEPCPGEGGDGVPCSGTTAGCGNCTLPGLQPRGRGAAHLNGLETPGADLALPGRQLASACSGLWQWLQKMVMVPARRARSWRSASRLLRLRLPLNPLTPAAPGLLL